MVNNIVVRVATGWDIKGNAVELNVGAEQSTIVKTTYADYLAGDLLRYTNSGAANEADWVLSKDGVFEVEGNDLSDTATYAVRASNQTVKLKDHEDGSFAKSPLGVALGSLQPQVASDVKTIYVAYNTNSKEVDYVEVKSGMQNITLSDLQKTGYCLEHQAEAAVGSLNSDNLPKDDANIKAIVIKGESKDATINNVGYVYDFHTNISKNENGDWLSEYNVYTMDGDDVKMTSTNNVGNRVYVRFTDLGDGTYRLTKLSNDPGNNVHPESDIDMYRMAIETQGDDYRFALDGERKYGKDEDGRPFVERMTAKAVYTEKDIPYIYTNKNPGGLDLTSGDSYAGMISVYGARILDLRDDAKNKVSNAKELKALIKGDSTSDSPNANGNTVSVDIVYNDNPESDNFRMAYYVVLKGTTHKNSVNVYTSNMNGWGETNYASGKTDEEEPGDTPSTPGVTTLNGVTLMDTVGLDSITAAKITPQGNGKVDVTATFRGPAWATVDNGSGSAMINSAGDDPENLTFVATLKRNGNVYETQTFLLSDTANGGGTGYSAGTGSDCTIGYIESTASANAKDFKIDWTVAVNTNQSSISTDTWTVEISDVKWANAGVKYKLAADGKDALALGIVDDSDPTLAIPTNDDGDDLGFEIAATADIAKKGYKAGKTASWEVTEGATAVSGSMSGSKAFDSSSTTEITGPTLSASGDGWVIVEIGGVTKDEDKVSAVAMYNGKETFGDDKEGLFVDGGVLLNDMGIKSVAEDTAIQLILEDNGDDDPEPANGLHKGTLTRYDSFTLSVDMNTDNEDEEAVAGYLVTVKVTGGASKTITSNPIPFAAGVALEDGPVEVGTFTVIGDELKIDVEITQVKAVTLYKAEIVNGYTIKLIFTDSIDKNSALADPENTFLFDGTLDKEWEEGVSVRPELVKSNAVEVSTTNVENDTITLTVRGYMGLVSSPLTDSNFKDITEAALMITGLTSHGFVVEDCYAVWGGNGINDWSATTDAPDLDFGLE